MEITIFDHLFTKIASLLTERVGLIIMDRDHKKLRDAIEKRMHHLHFIDPLIYLQKLLLEDAPEFPETVKLACLLTNKESFFFRDKGQFALLKNELLPTLVRQKANTRELKIWSAGCSTGEEVYSIVITLLSILPNWKNWQLLVLGTDLCPDVLEKAKIGSYNPISFRTMEEEIKKKYFSLCPDTRWQIDDTIRKIVRFEQLNLVRNEPFKNLWDSIDLIVCRNVFIYFHQELSAKIIKNFTHTLAPGGYLLTGHGEVYLFDTISSGLKTVSFKESFVYHRSLD